ncbi:MAG: alkaline phosphatase family protein [Planctomycetota bacterium]|jgi:2,3-bisphosphoglycerate-independent phosphoglycerate mutase
MDAEGVTEELLKRLESNEYAFIAVNYANGDMVGHTGNFDSARDAIEVVDRCVGQVVDRILELDGHVLITADHGNSEQMVDYDTGMTKTSHTLCPVELIHVGNGVEGETMVGGGKLSDIAPTALFLLGLEIPSEMTAHNLIQAKGHQCGGCGGCGKG